MRISALFASKPPAGLRSSPDLIQRSFALQPVLRNAGLQGNNPFAFLFR
jgi:hypothetical protein